MKLLTGQSSWRQWIKEKEGRFADVRHPEPKRHLCFGYKEFVRGCGVGEESLRSIYLYQHDIEAMALDLISVHRF
jgi:hypothetical protein